MVPFIVLLTLSHSTQGQNVSGVAPQGCIYYSGDYKWSCDFQKWMPPLKDEDFGQENLYRLIVTNIDGSFPAGAFSGLNGSSTNSDTYIHMSCSNSNTRLFRDTFTPNLHWVSDLRIYRCYIENGWPSRLLENLTGLKYLFIWKGGIEGTIAQDSLVGLKKLEYVTLQTPIRNGSFLSGFFDGLTNLISIKLTDAQLGFIPPNSFNGLDSLKWIHLDNNNLIKLPTGIFDGLRSLTSVNLANNPWNCSCGFTWIIDWSHIVDGDVCQDPSVVRKMTFKDAFGLLDCKLSTLTPLSTATFDANKATEIQTSPISTFTGFMVSSIATVSRKERITTVQNIFAISVTSTPFPLALTTTSAPRTLTVASDISTSTALIDSTASSTANVIGPINSLLSLSSILFAPATITQAVNSLTTKGYVSLKGRNNKDANLNDIRNAVLISGVGSLIVLLAVAACLHLNNSTGSMNRVDNVEEERHGSDFENRPASS